MYSIEISHEPTQNEAMKLNKGLFNAITSAVEPLTLGSSEVDQSKEAPSYQEVMQMIDRTISQMKVYVVESEITNTQNAIKTVIQQASF